MSPAELKPPHQPGGLLRLVALFKFSKAALLVAVGLGALELVRQGIATQAQRWVNALAASSDRRVLEQLVSLVSGLGPKRLEVVGIGALLFAALFTIEGLGLWLAKRWAEYLTVIATMSFVPLEVFELVRRPSPSRVTALLVNLAVAAYLIDRLRRPRGAVPTAGGAAA